MIWNLLGVFIIGLCAGAFGYMLRKLSKGRLPKWLVPAFAGMGMFGYLAYYDYAWYDFKHSQMPQDSMVIQTYREADFFRPWSYLAPSISKFDVFDGQFTVQQQGREKIAQYRVYRFQKDPLEKMTMLVHVLNCSTLERVAFEQDQPQSSRTVETISSDDMAYKKICPTP